MRPRCGTGNRDAKFVFETLAIIVLGTSVVCLNFLPKVGSVEGFLGLVFNKANGAPRSRAMVVVDSRSLK